MDGNFQHCRHKAASASWREISTLPSLFLPQANVDRWDDCNRPTPNTKNNDPIDLCTASHTAANDARGNRTWRACDETELFAMACWHDHLLKFINIVQSGERGHFPVAMIDWLMTELNTSSTDLSYKLAVLYDIGCTLERRMEIRDTFTAEREQGRLMFGTGAWHSYAHIRLCQIKYSPRLNPDWGMSDGEGVERIWSELCDLVAVLRYSTKDHCLWALHLQEVFYNEKGKLNSVESMIRRMRDMKKLLLESRRKLDQLLQDPNYTIDYIKDQWNRQRECQLKAICTKSIKALTDKLAHLVDLEENLHQ